MACKHFAKLPSERIGIRDEVVALDFDIAVALLVELNETEKETRRFEAMTSATVASAFMDEPQVTIDGRPC